VQARDYYEDARLWSAERYETSEEQRRIGIAAALLPPSATSLLDVGCGNGAFLRALEQTTSLRLAGVEPSAAARAAAVCATPVHEAGADSMPFPDGAFDVVSALEVLEHLPLPIYEPAKREMRRVAGRFVMVSVPYGEWTHQTRCPACGCRFHPHYHMRTFDEGRMRELFRPMRLDTLRVVDGDDYLGGGLLRAAYRRMASGSEFLQTSVCPQCGLRGDEIARQPAALNAKRALAAGLKHRLPRVRRPRWMVAVYRRP
jgi:SAM-dependent methyltransferase